MSANDCVYPFPGRSQSLSRFVEVPDFAAITRAVLDAVDVLHPSWVPLSAEAVLIALDGYDPLTQSLVDVARPHRLLVNTKLSAGVRVAAVMADPVTTDVDDLSRHVVEGWLEGALRDVAPGEGQHGEWVELAFRACRAWVGPPNWRSGETNLRLRHESGSVVVPIERTPSGAWLSGPREPAFDQSPVAVQFTHDMGLITLQLTRHYGYWLEPSEPAAQRFDEIVDRLRAIGWAGTDGDPDVREP